MATLKKLMTLINREGLTASRAEVILTFTNGRTRSARELTSKEIERLCLFFEKGAEDTLDKKRKQLIAAIFGMYAKMNKSVDLDYVKGTACKAAGVSRFNNIPATRLTSLYAAFVKAQKDLDFTGRLVKGYIQEQQSYN